MSFSAQESTCCCLYFFLHLFVTQVKKAFFALVANGVRAAPLWESKKQSFVGERVRERGYKNERECFTLSSGWCNISKTFKEHLYLAVIHPQ